MDATGDSNEQDPLASLSRQSVRSLAQTLRAHGVVGEFVELFGPGLSSLSSADRATMSNMSPELGATATLSPVDANTWST